MLSIKILGIEYKLEYKFRAVKHNPCVAKTINLIMAMCGTEENAVKAYTDIADIVSTMFYAGCLKHNPIEESEVDDLLEEYFEEDEERTVFGLLQDILKQMEEDGFFKQIGLDKIFNQTEEEKPKKTTRKKKTENLTTEE